MKNERKKFQLKKKSLIFVFPKEENEAKRKESFLILLIR